MRPVALALLPVGVEAGMTGSGPRLCYLDAANVIGPTGQMMAAMPVQGRREASLGTMAGVLIEPEQRRVRCLVVRSAADGRRCYVVPVDAVARVQRAEASLVLDADDLTVWALFDRKAVDDFTEEDAIAPSFHKYLAPGRPRPAVPGIR
jgi:hypothetical protein